MAEHTAGPWTCEPSKWEKAHTCIMGANGLAVAHTIFAEDAPLIAAAPTLLEVARDAIEIITLYIDPQAMGTVSDDEEQWLLRDEYLDNIRAVVAKATGSPMLSQGEASNG